MCCTGRAKYNDATDSLRQTVDAVTRESFVHALDALKRGPVGVSQQTKNAADPKAARRTVLCECELIGCWGCYLSYSIHCTRFASAVNRKTESFRVAPAGGNPTRSYARLKIDADIQTRRV